MPKIHPNALIFSFTPITIKPHTVKVYMKSNIFVLQVSWKNLTFFFTFFTFLKGTEWLCRV